MVGLPGHGSDARGSVGVTPAALVVPGALNALLHPRVQTESAADVLHVGLPGRDIGSRSSRAAMIGRVLRRVNERVGGGGTGVLPLMEFALTCPLAAMARREVLDRVARLRTHRDHGLPISAARGMTLVHYLDSWVDGTMAHQGPRLSPTGSRGGDAVAAVGTTSAGTPLSPEYERKLQREAEAGFVRDALSRLLAANRESPSLRPVRAWVSAWWWCLTTGRVRCGSLR